VESRITTVTQCKQLLYIPVQAILNDQTKELKIKKLVKVIKLAHEIINGKYQWQIFISL